ncbi:nucleotide-binding protein [Acidicapsa ligni]|uniref:nucleotide-binding protein n=1 Tax=Acidicapsa ligni TaxID=542300 RepID=UPI0021E05E93|nr:AAA family ATPase [Acidicapsa ligni]
MPTIAFVSPKGGVGKTTSAFLFSTAIAEIYDITLIDADPNHPIKTWAEGGNTPKRMTIVSDADEDRSSNVSKTRHRQHRLSLLISKAQHQ